MDFWIDRHVETADIVENHDLRFQFYKHPRHSRGMNIAVTDMSPRKLLFAKKRLRKEGVRYNYFRDWFEREDDACRILFPDIKEIRRFIWWRSEGAIIARCKRLGLGRRDFHRWTARDISILRKLYPAAPREDICAAIPGVDWKNIRATAQRHGLRRLKKPYKITGINALDEVRLKCYDLRWTMRDLDEECRTKRYFQTRGYRCDYPNFKAINTAVLALGGILEVTWLL